VVFFAEDRERLDRFLARRLPDHSRTKLVKMIDSGGVMVDGRAQRSSFMLGPGSQVELGEPPPTASHKLDAVDIPLEIPYEDDHLLVVNKPRGLATHPAASLKEPSLVNALLGRHTVLSGVAGDFRPGIVHRLDKDTSGLLVVAKNDSVHVKLARQIELKQAERRYFAVVGGNVERPRFVIDAPIARNKSNRQQMQVDADGKRAVTHVRRLRTLPLGTALAVRLETGRTHQIRVHLSAVGMPVLGDRLYGKGGLDIPMQLHAAYLEFTHPVTEARIAIYVPPAEGFLAAEGFTREDIDPF
jgi:23S rRNA pseudouridine1911/1915/1917 synthase